MLSNYQPRPIGVTQYYITKFPVINIFITHGNGNIYPIQDKYISLAKSNIHRSNFSSAVCGFCDMTVKIYY